MLEGESEVMDEVAVRKRSFVEYAGGHERSQLKFLMAQVKSGRNICKNMTVCVPFIRYLTSKTKFICRLASCICILCIYCAC